MKALRKVDIGVLTDEPKEEFLCALVSSLSKTSALRSLHLVSQSGSLDFVCDISPPPLLQHLSLSGSIRQLPDWISSLVHLTKFQVGWTKLVGDQLFGVLCKLPNLKSIQLGRTGYKDRELVARPDTSRKRGFYPGW
uniref:Disease resistance R13L4/SHOC-2-like LRR domain-containing protein n=1 Tax=Aegilops tauschii TaxID=37682 RepID=R7WDZ3_AEGTA